MRPCARTERCSGTALWLPPPSCAIAVQSTSTRVRHGCGLRRPWITLALSLAYVMLGCAWFVFNAARLPKPPVIQRMLGIAVGSKLVQCVLQMVYLRILQLSGDVLKSISNMYASATCVIEAGEHL